MAPQEIPELLRFTAIYGSFFKSAVIAISAANYFGE
jgi:hypothetical protein